MMKDPGDTSGWVPTTTITTPRWLRGIDGVHDGGDDDTSTTSHQNMSAFVFLTATSATFMLLFVIFYREYYWRKHGVDTCLGYGCSGRSRQQIIMQRERDRVAGEAERDKEGTLQCHERRLWYESYIKAFTMVSTRM